MVTNVLASLSISKWLGSMQCSKPGSLSALPDGLVDCLDPDCCLQSACQNSLLCRGSRDPLDIIQQGQTDWPAVKSFYDRIKLLAGKDSTHIIPGDNPFNSRQVPFCPCRPGRSPFLFLLKQKEVLCLFHRLIPWKLPSRQLTVWLIEDALFVQGCQSRVVVALKDRTTFIPEPHDDTC